MAEKVRFEDLTGKTIKSIEGLEKYSYAVYINLRNEKYLMTHQQKCCEIVNIEDVCGDIDDIIGSPILIAEEVSYLNSTPSTIKNVPIPTDYEYSFRWTFYKLATIKGSITIRWYGSSNGNYSEEVSIYKLQEGEEDVY